MYIKDDLGGEIFLHESHGRRAQGRTVVLSTAADFFNGMATAWAFAAYDALSRLSWGDLLTALLLAILSLSVSIGAKLKLTV